ncbi:MAG: hypothetical protein L0Z54_02590 [Thermoplasmata archaeon]|nr:hypothetical protein [Thermoplasmata archaeon]
MRRPLLAIVPLAIVALALTGSATGAPVARAEVWDGEWETEGTYVLQGMTVRFSAENSFGEQLTFLWDMDNWTDSNEDGDPMNDIDASGANLTWTFREIDEAFGYLNITITLLVEDGAGNDTDDLWINVTENLPPFLGISAYTALVGQDVDLVGHMSISDPEEAPLLLRVDLDGARDSDKDGNATNDVDVEWLSSRDEPPIQVYEGAGQYLTVATLTDGFTTVTAQTIVSIYDAGTEVRIGDHYSNTDTVFRDAYMAYHLKIGNGDRLKVIFRVIQGDTPLVLAMPEDEYLKFGVYATRFDFSTIPDLSEPNGTRSKIFKWTSEMDGHLYLVVDNGYLGDGADENLKASMIISLDRKRETPAPGAASVSLAFLTAALLFAARRRPPLSPPSI